ncbi:hypothetical protein GUT184_07590 [Streptococcus ruminantium]|nr:hypothetical protein GUT184_07590 [Streptococcus ruminantium]
MDRKKNEQSVPQDKYYDDKYSKSLKIQAFCGFLRVYLDLSQLLSIDTFFAVDKIG